METDAVKYKVIKPIKLGKPGENGPSNDISVGDAATNTVTEKIKAGSSPWGVLALDR